MRMSNLAHYYDTNFIIIDQSIHEHQVTAPVLSLEVASVAHPEENSLASHNVITQANLRNTKPEQNLSVSY